MNHSLAMLLVMVFALVVFTRLLPFIFARHLKQAHMVQAVGKQLPAYIMGLLLVYEVQISTFLKYPYGLPELMALMVVIAVQLWRRQLLLSMCLGTACYALLLKFIF